MGGVHRGSPKANRRDKLMVNIVVFRRLCPDINRQVRRSEQRDKVGIVLRPAWFPLPGRRIVSAVATCHPPIAAPCAHSLLSLREPQLPLQAWGPGKHRLSPLSSPLLSAVWMRLSLDPASHLVDGQDHLVEPPGALLVVAERNPRFG